MSVVKTVLRNRTRLIVILFLCCSVGFVVYVHSDSIINRSNIVSIYQAILDQCTSFLKLGATNEVKFLKCPGNPETFPEHALSQQWQQVGNTKDLYVFSAYMYYFDDGEPYVQVIGIALLAAKVKCSCVFHQSNVIGNVISVDGILEVLTENNNRPYSAVYIRCPFKEDFKPAVVGIQLKNSTTFLRVIYASPLQYNFTVCISSLYGPYWNYWDIIGMVEADRLFGADYFLVYNYSTTPEVDKVLKYYSAKGIMKVIPWNVPNVDVHYFGQVASLQDCVFESRVKSKYVVLKDVDELIVPHKHNNWHDLMNFVNTNNSKIALYLFRNSYFRLNWGQNVEGFVGRVASEMLKLKNLLYVWRENYIFPTRDRTKAILKPEHVFIAGIHGPKKLAKGYGYYTVDPEVAFLHHYRTINRKTPKVKDDTMRKYADDLINKVSHVFTDLGSHIVNGTYHISV